MSENHFLPVGIRVNSCLIGANAYLVSSNENDFAGAALEELCDSIRQRPGHHYMRICTTMDKSELWMVPFESTPETLENLQDAVEEVQGKWWGTPGFHFPFDLVEEETENPSVLAYMDPELVGDQPVYEHPHGTCTGYVISPFDRTATKPFRLYLPTSSKDRWTLAKNLFSRVAQLHEMGLSSNGISREQLRVNEKTLEVELFLTHTLRLVKSRFPQGLHHQGFGSIPIKVVQTLRDTTPVTSVQRDIFSCAVWAFYLITYTHPFIGKKYADKNNKNYLNSYLNSFPSYIMDPSGENGLGNQPFDDDVRAQWEKTAPELKKLFDGLFMDVSHADLSWDDTAPWWKIESWLEALEADFVLNGNEDDGVEVDFDSYLYHLV